MASHSSLNEGGARALPIDLALSIIPRLPRPLLARFVALAIERLDTEDGDPDLEDATDAEDEELSPWALRYGAPGGGCLVSDPGGGNVEDEGEAIDESEGEQMTHDVPCLRVFAIEPNSVTGKRDFLGMSNLSPSFVSSPMPASV